MKKSQISFKIKNEKNYDSIRFMGGSISLKDLKNKIKEKLQDKNTGPSKEKDKEKKDDILVYDEMTKQLITDDSTLIASDKKVVIERVSYSLPQPTTTYRDRGLTSMRADKSEFMCKLCKNQFVNPSLTRCCGDTACETCLDKYVKQKNECPFCKKKALSSIKAGPNTKVQEMIQKLSMTVPSQPTSVVSSHPYGYQPPNSNSTYNFNQLPFRDIDKYLSGAKYFIIKSSNFENIELSIKHSEWATTKANETKLNNAFQRSKNVILIFSVNKSSQFQGYARMESLSTNRVTSWQGQESIKLGGPFKVLWLRVCNVNFSRVSQMKNKFNNNEPIKKSRDTQEIPEDIGLDICKMFELPDKDNNYYPISNDQRKYMYPFGSTPPAPYGTSGGMAMPPFDPRMAEPASDSGTQSDTKTLTPKRMNDELQSEEDKEDASLKMEIEKKKDEPKFDLLADLDFDEPVVFNTNEEEVTPVNNTVNENIINNGGENHQQKIDEISPNEPQRNPYEGLLDDLPMEHEVANIDDITEMTDAAVSAFDQQTGDIVQNGTYSAKSETKESPMEYKSESEKIQEETKSQNFFEEEENRSIQIEQEETKSDRRYPDRKSSKSSRTPSLSREREQEKMIEEEKKKPPKPPVELPKQPPPQMHYDPHMMAASHGQMMRPSYGMDHRPPPPPGGSMSGMMYPPSTQQSMRYPGAYPGYPGSYPPAPYSNYPMAPYPTMDQQMRPGMGMPPNYQYSYYGYPGMWNGNRQMPYGDKGKQEGNEGDDNMSQASDDSDSSRKREKKRSKKEKKKKRSHERHREHREYRDKSREKSEERDRNRSRDRNRNKSKSKSRRK